jgi:integrase
MSRPATGSITPTREGRHRVRVPAEGRRVDIGTFDTRAEAELELAAAMQVLAEAPRAGLLVGDWLDKHLGQREVSKRFRDAENERAYFKRDIETDPLARLPLKAARPHDVDDFVDRLRAKGHATGTVRKVLSIVRVGFKAAVRKGLMSTNPAADVPIAADRRTVEPWTYATRDEQDALVEAARAHCAATPRLTAIPIDALLDFAIGAGLRAGELVTLRLADVSVDGDAPKVTVRYGTVPDLPTKTGKIRDVPLFDRALDGMRRWLAAMPTWVKANPDELVFVGARGGYRSEDHVLRWDDWKAILERAGITRPFRWHDLRHTCASSLVSGFWGRRWSLEEVREVLGHSDIKTTQRYAHLAPSAVQAAAREADALARVRRGGGSGGGSGEAAGNRTRVALSSLPAEPRAAFLKRWSYVRIVSGALKRRPHGHAACGAHRRTKVRHDDPGFFTLTPD